MKIIPGLIYENKTKTYLLSTLIEYGEDFEERFSRLFKLAIGIGDYALMDMGILIDDSIYILIDTKFSRKSFKNVMEWVKSQKYYQIDYPFDDIHLGHLHMLVIKIPERFKETVNKFHQSQYSEMYDYEDLMKYFGNRPGLLSVLNKDPEQVEGFVEHINTLYNTDMLVEDWEGEVDFPIKDEEEFFNVKLFIKEV
jgi:hypothetical protein